MKYDAVILWKIPTDWAQLLITILASFQTTSLLQLRPVSSRLQDVVLRIVQDRLLLATSLKDRRLILECYHPSKAYTEPYVFCDYLGTPGMHEDEVGQWDVGEGLVSGGSLGGLYSVFRPTKKESSPSVTRPHPAGDVPGSRTSRPAPRHFPTEDKNDLVTRTVSLESHELFSQLRFSASLVQEGPRKGVFMSCAHILEKRTPRIWRTWLADAAKSFKTIHRTSESEKLKTPRAQHDCASGSLIWVDPNQTAGVRVRVEEKKWVRRIPILVHVGEDQNVSYNLIFEGKQSAAVFLGLSLRHSTSKQQGNTLSN